MSGWLRWLREALRRLRRGGGIPRTAYAPPRRFG